MASLTSIDPNELALVSLPAGGLANFTVDATGSTSSPSKVEIWERDLPFAAVTSLPPFTKSGTFPSGVATSVTKPVALGGIHQVRLFFVNQGNASGNTSISGELLGRLDFTCVRRAARVNFLTRCASMPQIDLTTGGTFISMAFATNVPARARVQIGVNPPALDGAGFPFFAPGDVVASVVTDGPKLLQKVSLIDELTSPDISGHPALRTGQKLFFVILCWDALGSWDLVWNTTGVAPATPPDKKRVVDVRLHRLRCLDDSDHFSNGEATFKFIVNDLSPTTPTVKTVSWDPMTTGGQKLIPLRDQDRHRESAECSRRSVGPHRGRRGRHRAASRPTTTTPRRRVGSLIAISFHSLSAR
jgi:hypothetical protein